jgi:hypothetical protein
MKKLIYSFMTVGLISACYKGDAENTLVGKYQLIEVLADPGDGSGVFKPVTSNKVLEFKQNNSVHVNGYFCTMSTETGQTYKGVYSLVDSTITMDSCSYDLTFKVNGAELIINYPCFEPCQVKYKKQ